MADKREISLINYEVVEVLHTSSTWGNIVLKVKPFNKDNLFVLKCFPRIESGLQRIIFYREMEALKVLNASEGIVHIRDVETGLHPLSNTHDSYGGILMDYIPGKTLDCIAWDDIPQLKKYEICSKIISALNRAHSNSVIHRDIKPSNIIYDQDRDDITIIDFGTSKIKSIIDSETTMPLFSEGYSAPEIIAGNGITEKCDYYSLGVVLYEILLSRRVGTYLDMRRAIDLWNGRKEIKELLLKLTQQDEDARPDSLNDVLDVFMNLISSLNTNSYEFHIIIDSGKLELLKKKYVIDRSMNMAQFTTSFLRKQFLECYGYYDNRKSQYVLTGTDIVLFCSYDEDTGRLTVIYVSEVTADKRNFNIKRGFKIQGKFVFHASHSLSSIPVADNPKLVVMFNNHLVDDQLYRNREEKFEEMFSLWEQGLKESIESEKNSAATLTYNPDYQILNNHLVLEIEDCQNKTLDELIIPSKYVVEGVGKKGLEYTDVGILDDIVCEDNRVCAYFALTKGKLRPGVSRLLKKNAVVCEDFQSRTAGYRRQFKAINNLKADDYSARSLKDIILGFEEPEEIPTITQPQFISEKLNDSQKKAVIKSLNTENICLIQGPPGTGKTSVIKEIIGQIIRRDIKTTDSPKILIVSQSHTAVDNILEGLDVIIPDSTKIVRIGADKNISLPITEKYTIGAHERHLVKTIRENIQLYRSEKEGIYAGIDDQGEKQKWEKIKAIQEDWLNRLADQESLDYQLIRSATVIAGTCIGFLANNVIRDMSFDYVIIDEAAKATTPELLVSIIRAKKIILVGDQNQLPAYANRAISETIATLTKDPNFRLFDIFYSFLPDTHKQILTTQYRMIENIGNLISEVFYDGRIDTGCSDDEKQHGIARYYGKSILWFDTSENKRKAQKKTKGGSFINEEEKRIVLEILEDLKQSGELNGKDIGIITGYSGQKDLLRKAVKANGYGAIAAIDINTLDAFQGRENDIIIYSTVRTRDSIGFQKEKERVNVAFSRAKKLLIVCGDMNFFYNYNDPDNKFIQIIDYINEHKQCGVIACNGGSIF